MRDIIIVGAGSVGGHIASNAASYGIEKHLLGFLDDDLKKQETQFCGFPVIGSLNWLKGKSNLSVILGIAFPKVKKEIYDIYLKGKNFIFPSLIHSTAWISQDCSIADGTIIYPHTSINYGSQIGCFCVLNMNCALGHHAIIGDFSSLSPGVNLGGNTTLGNKVEMGIGSCTLQNLSIGHSSLIGGQSMVVASLPPFSKAKGVPAKKKES